MSTPQGVQQLIDTAQRDHGGAHYAGEVSVQEVGNGVYGSIPKQFARQIDIEKQDRIERYVDYGARCVVMFFPQEELGDE